MGRRIFVVLLLSVCLIAHVLPTEARRSPGSVLRSLDTNNDNAVDLSEAQSAASVLFDPLDKDKRGTLGPKELAGRVSATELKGEHLTKAKYLALVEERFRKADVNGDGKLSLKELTSPAGGEFTKLVFYVIVE